MKTIRIINIAFWSILALVLIIASALTWEGEYNLTKFICGILIYVAPLALIAWASDKALASSIKQ